MLFRDRLARTAAAVALGGVVWLGARGGGALPPLGPLLTPVRGAWGLAAAAEFPAHSALGLPGLGRDVRVVYDDRAVPHLFAASELDAYRALGYVTARDRLFQLELQARAGAGTLTELLGAGALEPDREARGLGLARAAERLASRLPATGPTRAALDAYAAGVNAYIERMSAGELPLEYRLLNRRPVRWSPARTLQVALRMGYILTQDRTDLDHLRAAALVGSAAADGLFPLHAPIQEPIQPSRARIAGPSRIAAPSAPDSAPLAPTAASQSAPLAPVRTPSRGLPAEAFHVSESAGDAAGSNNWAVAPRRTRAGAALLAGDPHLELRLPSIWYEVQLSVPGHVDVYGVTIPGLPAVLIGFNRDVAWTFTNTEADLMDRWRETVDDPVRPARYRLDGAWMPIEVRTETYRGPHGEILATDTLRFTHRGPLTRFGGRWLSTRWTALESADETGVFHKAARARTARDWLGAMALYRSPPQNMLVADRAGTIAIRSTGRFPIRAGDGRGDRIRDGSTRANDWTGDWSPSEYPQALDPAQGFLASANQEPLAPEDQRRYLGANWLPPWRALRINALLRSDSAVTPGTMRRWQTDPGSPRADFYVPYFLAAAAPGSADTTLAHAARLLAAWDRTYTRENEGAVLFEEAMAATTSAVWDELPPDLRPGGGALIALMDDPGNRWWDDRRTPGIVEQRDDLLASALADGYRATVAAHGPPQFGGWRWSAAHRISIWHVLRLPTLSALDVEVPGGPSTLSPSSSVGGGEGSSWRMVVELGPELRAWGTYPGGQSGNPASRHYDDRLPQWRAGELADLRFPRSPGDVRASAELLLRAAP